MPAHRLRRPGTGARRAAKWFPKPEKSRGIERSSRVRPHGSTHPEEHFPVHWYRPTPPMRRLPASHGTQ